MKLHSSFLITVALFISSFAFSQQTVGTVAGSGIAGYLDGASSSAQFNGPYGVTMDQSGNIYLADAFNHRIRKIDVNGTVSTLAGSGSPGYQDGAGTSAQFWTPTGVFCDNSGNVYVADNFNNRIRMIDPSGTVTTVAGTGPSGPSTGTHADGPALGGARFFEPKDIWVSDLGVIYVADYENHKIRKIENGTVTTLSGTWNDPRALVGDNQGNLYVCDQSNNYIKMVDDAGVVTIIAGSGSASSADGQGSAASINHPVGIDIDSDGNLYVCEGAGHFIRKIDTNYNVTTIAGTGSSGYLDGPALSAQFNVLTGICVVPSQDRVIIGDRDNHRVRELTLPGVVKGVYESAEDMVWTMYPNPAINQLIVSVESTSQISAVEMYDTYGKLVLSHNVGVTERLFQLNVSDISAGMYYIRLTTSQGISTKAVVLR